jgi:hypothetical protein
MHTRDVFLMSALSMTLGCTGASPITPTADAAPLAAESLNADALASDVRGPRDGLKLQKVKSGTIATTSTSMGGAATLRGVRFDITGEWSGGGSVGCQPCGSGAEPIWTSAAFAGSRGSATVEGVHYDAVYLTGVITVSGTVLVPAVDTPTFTVTFPFTVTNTSFLSGYATDPSLGPTQELFRLDVRGSGTASVELSTIRLPDSTAIYTAHAITYAF